MRQLDDDIETPKNVPGENESDIVAVVQPDPKTAAATSVVGPPQVAEVPAQASKTSPTNNNHNAEEEEEEDTSAKEKTSEKNGKKNKSISQRLWDFLQQQEFLILILAAIGLAKAYPKLGADYLQPDITATWVAVILIFLLSGISLRTNELFGAVLHHWRFHILVQLVSLGVVPAVVFGISRALADTVISRELADGMVVCACLPITINMVIVLTTAAQGDTASALFGAVLGNGVGVVLSPLLILGYLGAQGNVDIGTVFLNLALRVFLPVVVGQILQKTTSIYETLYEPHKKAFTKLQQLILAFIVYTVFCETFQQDKRSRISDIFLMIVFQFLLLASFMVISWFVILRCCAPQQRVMGLFGCTHKSIAIGIPLLNALYEDSPETKALYTLPLLVWHPLQLVLGTLVTPYLCAYVEANVKPVTAQTESSGDTN